MDAQHLIIEPLHFETTPNGPAELLRPLGDHKRRRRERWQAEGVAPLSAVPMGAERFVKHTQPDRGVERIVTQRLLVH